MIVKFKVNNIIHVNSKLIGRTLGELTEGVMNFVKGNIIGLQTLDDMKIQGGKDMLVNILEPQFKKQERKSRWQIIWLGLGFLSFFIWLIIDLYF